MLKAYNLNQVASRECIVFIKTLAMAGNPQVAPPPPPPPQSQLLCLPSVLAHHGLHAVPAPPEASHRAFAWALTLLQTAHTLNWELHVEAVPSILCLRGFREESWVT